MTCKVFQFLYAFCDITVLPDDSGYLLVLTRSGYESD